MKFFLTKTLILFAFTPCGTAYAETPQPSSTQIKAPKGDDALRPSSVKVIAPNGDVLYMPRTASRRGVLTWLLEQTSIPRLLNLDLPAPSLPTLELSDGSVYYFIPFPTLQKMMASEDPQQQLSAIKYIVESGGARGLEERSLIYDYLYDENPKVREAVIYALRDSISKNKLLNRLLDPSPEVRIAAAIVLSEKMYLPSPYMIQSSFKRKRNPDNHIKQALLGRLWEDPDNRVKMAVAISLSYKAFDPEIRKALTAALSDPDPLVARNAGFALWPSNDEPEIRQQILNILSGIDPAQTRQILFEYDIKFRSPIFDKIRELLSDPEPLVRMAAVVAYGGVLYPLGYAYGMDYYGMERLLENLRNDPHPLVRQAVESWKAHPQTQERHSRWKWSGLHSKKADPPEDPCLNAARGI